MTRRQLSKSSLLIQQQQQDHHDIILLRKEFYYIKKVCLSIIPFLIVLSFYLQHRPNQLIVDIHHKIDIFERNNVGNILHDEHQQQHHQSKEYLENRIKQRDVSYDGPMIDIISIGSLSKVEFQNAQERTFGRSFRNHQNDGIIRNFFRINELNDTEATCYTNLTMENIKQIIQFCNNTDITQQSYISTTLRQELFQPKQHIGWMCAQKRPIDGLYHVLQLYQQQVYTIPDYLFIIDDDTYINIHSLVHDLIQYYPTNYTIHNNIHSNNGTVDHQEQQSLIPHVIAGCNYDFLKKSGITFPYGGFGSYMNQYAIEKLLQPIYCDGRDEHSNLNCWRINQNLLNEKQYYVEGMNVIELMYQYTSNLQFTKVNEWITNNNGYCLHSDHALAYFINFYHITVPDGTVLQYQRPNDKITRRKYHYKALQGPNECNNERSNCTTSSRICHYIEPKQMDELFITQQQQNLKSKNIQQNPLFYGQRG